MGVWKNSASLTIFISCAAFATGASAAATTFDLTGAHPPRASVKDLTGAHPPRASVQDLTGAHPPRVF
ncbi:MAG: hypothetical protein JSR95_10085 [Proteobacteria bacterium]|nr:hypothetical protein [Pseudomonadota bacterium]